MLQAFEGVFDGAHAGGSNGEAGTVGGMLECGQAIGRDGIPAVVDGVFANVLYLDGVEGTDADLQGEVVEAIPVFSRAWMS